MRLDKFICEASAKTRTEAKRIISGGAVCVNGVICKKADTQVSESENITLFGEKLIYNKYVYIMLDKPKGVVSASEDKNDITVIDLVKDEFPRRNLFPAGRLDKTSTGFVLITDDGNFAHDILSPKHHVPKTYEVLLDTPLTDQMVEAFEKGVVLADGTELASASVHTIKDNWVEVVLSQGVYHQIKRMFGVYEAGVNELRRTKIGGLSLDKTLKQGEYRLITNCELENIIGR